MEICGSETVYNRLRNAAKWYATYWFVRFATDAMFTVQHTFGEKKRKKKGTMKWWCKCGRASGCVHTGQRCHKNSAFLKNSSDDTVHVYNPWTQGQLCPTGYIRSPSVFASMWSPPPERTIARYSVPASQQFYSCSGASPTKGGSGVVLATPSVIPLSQNMVGYLPCEGWEFSLNSLMINR